MFLFISNGFSLIFYRAEYKKNHLANFSDTKWLFTGAGGNESTRPLVPWPLEAPDRGTIPEIERGALPARPVGVAEGRCLAAQGIDAAQGDRRSGMTDRGRCRGTAEINREEKDDEKSEEVTGDHQNLSGG